LLEKKNPQISQRRQAALLAVARSSAAHEPVPEREVDRQAIRIMDELYLKAPSLGSRPLVTLLERDHGILINRMRVQRLRRAMGLEAIWCRPRTTVPDRSQRKYPYLLRDLKIDRANQVWCTDFTYVPMPVGHAYLYAMMDWHTRKVLGWTVSNTMDTELCLNALQQVLAFVPGGYCCVQPVLISVKVVVHQKLPDMEPPQWATLSISVHPGPLTSHGPVRRGTWALRVPSPPRPR
jgi:putative transposase